MLFWILATVFTFLSLAFLLPRLLIDPANQQLKQKAGKLKKQLRNLEKMHQQELVDDATFAERKKMLQQQIIEHLDEQQEPVPRSSWTATVLILAVPLFSVLFYMMLGQPEALDPQALIRQNTDRTVNNNANSAPGLNTMIQPVIARLESDPDNLADLMLLARSYVELRNFPEAVKIAERAYKVRPNEPEVMALLAQTQIFNDPQRSIPAQSEQLLRDVYQVQPDNQIALLFLGFAEVREGRFQSAIDLWTTLRSQLPDGSGFAAQVDQHLTDARSIFAEVNGSEALAQSPQQATQNNINSNEGNGLSLSVQVSIDETLKSNTKPTDTVFVFARAAQGPRMPLAIQRLNVADLPATIILNESMAMSPAMSLNSFPEIVIGARISKSGQAAPQSGDLEGYSETLPNTHADLIELKINQIL